MKRLTSILIVTAILFSSCGKKPVAETVVGSVDTTVYKVKTTEISKEKVSRTIEYTANLLAYEELYYAPATPGRIDAIHVEVGTRVSKGDLLVEMDPTQLMQAKESYMNAKWTFERMDTLHNQNSISEQQYEGAKVQYEMAKTSYEFMLRNTRLTAPFNGIITGKYYENGEVYSGAPNTAAGKAAIVTLMQISPLKTIVNVSEKYFPLVKNGMTASVKVDLYSDKSFNGRVSRVYPTISADTRTFPVEIEISNPNETLRPGMFARISLDLGEVDVLVIPAIGVMKQDGTNDRYIFLANADSSAHKIYIKIGDRFDDKLEVLSEEIKEGDVMITAGQEKLIEGSRFTVKN